MKFSACSLSVFIAVLLFLSGCQSTPPSVPTDVSTDVSTNAHGSAFTEDPDHRCASCINVSELTHWREKALSGDTDASFLLGEVYYHGQVVEEDLTEALRWYRMAETGASASALARIGEFYNYGLGGLPKDDFRALAYYEKSAKLGEALGLDYLAWFLSTNENPQLRNPQRAISILKVYKKLYGFNHVTMDAFAVAYACLGDFPQAIKWEKMAIEFSIEYGHDEFLPGYEKRLALFLEEKPYIVGQ